jgi:glyoxylase-like metal-dependent hydrolase (beta-lactamase superfamily II)/ferredoxin
MASLAKRRSENAAGPIFVDSTCIDCGTCRWVAPASFDESGGLSRAWHQPNSKDERQRALMALVACPTGSIGSTQKPDLSAAVSAFPERIDDAVYHCGFHSEKSYGAASYLIRRPAGDGGNILVDSPRFARPLVDRIEQLGGISLIVLTHRDDIADHAAFAKEFGCRRLIHADDAVSGIRDAEIRIEGYEPVKIDDDFSVIPVPGHTRGSVCFLYRERHLFTGDHLRWDPHNGRLAANRSVCWYDWTAQIRSMEKLLTHRFEWILPGHGARIHLPEPRMKTELSACIERMKRP